jgi:hypothetical protein
VLTLCSALMFNLVFTMEAFLLTNAMPCISFPSGIDTTTSGQWISSNSFQSWLLNTSKSSRSKRCGLLSISDCASGTGFWRTRWLRLLTALVSFTRLKCAVLAAVIHTIRVPPAESRGAVLSQPPLSESWLSTCRILL